jgi:hypothetical protein
VRGGGERNSSDIKRYTNAGLRGILVMSRDSVQDFLSIRKYCGIKGISHHEEILPRKE